MYQQVERRPIKMRSARWSHRLASWLVARGLSPNQISMMSAGIATCGAGFYLTALLTSKMVSVIALIGAAFCIQGRLLCNMLDGLMAVENNKATKSGEIFNEFPDRIADVVLLVGAGYACNAAPLAVTLGWLSAVFALATAYIRAFGARYLAKQDFSGPLAKPQRMFLLTVGTMGGALELALHGTNYTLAIMLGIICFGTALTCVNRSRHLYQSMEKI